MITNKYFYQHQSIIQIGAFLLISVILFPSPICFPDNSRTYHIKDHLMALHIRVYHRLSSGKKTEPPESRGRLEIKWQKSRK